jgi:hypothetical protein
MAEKSLVKEVTLRLAAAFAVVAVTPPVVVVEPVLDDFPQATKPMVSTTVVVSRPARLSE